MSDEAAPPEPPEDDAVPRQRRRRRSSRRRVVQTPVPGTALRLAWKPPSAQQLLTGVLTLAALAVGAFALSVSQHTTAVLAQGEATLAVTTRGLSSGQSLADRLESSARARALAASLREPGLPPQNFLRPLPPTPVARPAREDDDASASPSYGEAPLPTLSPLPPPRLPSRSSSEMGYTLPGASAGSSVQPSQDAQAPTGSTTPR